MGAAQSTNESTGTSDTGHQTQNQKVWNLIPAADHVQK